MKLKVTVEEAKSLVGKNVQEMGNKREQDVYIRLGRLLSEMSLPPDFQIKCSSKFNEYNRLFRPFSKLIKDDYVWKNLQRPAKDGKIMDPPDVDMVLYNESTGIPLVVISIKASMTDDHSRSTCYTGLYYKKLDIPLWVITYDTKDTFKNGEKLKGERFGSKYITHIRDVGNIIIFVDRDGKTEYNGKILNMSQYTFNDVVKPFNDIERFIRLKINKFSKRKLDRVKLYKFCEY